MVSLQDLPGRELVEKGLLDVSAGLTTIEALLVTSALPRLEALGLGGAGRAAVTPEPELALYALLGRSGVPDPYSRYNALRRELASFIRSLEHRVWRERRAARVPSNDRPA